MEKTIIFGELLYIGFVAEKGRCKPQGMWKIGYKAILYKHIKILNKIAESMLNQFNLEKDQQILKEFYELCMREKEIGKFYLGFKEKYNMLNGCDFNITNYFDIGKNNEAINRRMYCLSSDILMLLNKKRFSNKKEIYMLLRSVHNLPRYYLRNDIETICNLNQHSISAHDALEYFIGNMDNKTKENYYFLYSTVY